MRARRAIHLIARVLDVGALGVMVPMVDEAEQAELLAASCRYPPAGRRGFGLVFHDDWEGDLRATTGRTRRSSRSAQIETVRGLENVEEMSAVDGIDVLLVGFADLTLSLGIPGDRAPISRRSTGSRRLPQPRQGGRGSSPPRSTRQRASWIAGYRFLAYGLDLVLYERALREGLDALRGRSAP